MRYLPLTEADRRAMLAAIGVVSVDALFNEVPATAVRRQPVDLPNHAGELEVERRLQTLARKNLVAGEVPFFLGAGAYRHPAPAAVDHLIQRGEFLTAYTPYQPEIAQGTLQYLFEFQTQVAMLTGMEVANASLYDGSTACTEAVLMANRITRRSKALLSGGLHPHYAEIVATHAAHGDFTLENADPDPENLENLIARLDERTACVVVQNPSVFGHIRDLSPLADAAHAKGALLVVVVTEAVAFGALVPPGAMGADIVVAEGQSIGGGLNFGGPYIGLFATREKYVRQMPGRLCGETLDVDGKRGWVLTLSAREQHIRREKATSNICTNAGLCALAFTAHLALLGETGFTQLAALNHAKASQLVEKLRLLPEVRVVNECFFNEVTLVLPKAATTVVEALAARQILAGVPAARLWPGRPELQRHLLVAVTESATEEDMDALVAGLKEALA